MIRREDLDTLSFDDIAPGPALPPLTPGEVLLEEFVRPLGLSAHVLAVELGVPGNRVGLRQWVAGGYRRDRDPPRLALRHQRGAVGELADRP